MIYASIRKIKDVDERNRIINKLQLLRSQLDKEIPEKTGNTLLIYSSTSGVRCERLTNTVNGRFCLVLNAEL